MTLAEAIELIKRVDSKTPVHGEQDPFQQICDAIEEGELRSRWLDPAKPPRDRSGLLWTPDEPYYSVGAFRTRRLRLDDGGEIRWSGRRWRKLLISREDMRSVFEEDRKNTPERAEQLKPLSKNTSGYDAIHEAILAVFTAANEQGIKPPNVREMRLLAQQWLKKYGHKTAPMSWIEGLAGDKRYCSQRGKPGATVKGRLRPVSELKI
jgi:hypothetical protein